MTDKHMLLVGASRGLGLAMAAEFLKKGWNVVGTVRGSGRTELHDLADEHPGRIEIESLDITELDQIAALHDRLSGRSFDILFHNAGVADASPHQSIAEVSTAEFVRVLITNAPEPDSGRRGITGPCFGGRTNRHHVVGTGEHQQQREGWG